MVINVKNKGLINISFIVMFFVVTLLSLHSGSELYINDVENDRYRDIHEYVDETFSYNSSAFMLEQYEPGMNDTEVYSIRINNMVTKAFDSLMHISFEYLALMTTIGYNSHGEYNTGVLISIVRVFFYAITLIAILIPVLIIGYLLYKLFIYLKQLYKKYKE
jgi:hypothetical protein